MDEAQSADERGARERWAHDAPETHLPGVGIEVAGYLLERRLATGGQGTVFRARREGRHYAVKFIFLPRSAHWARRELDVMVKLWRAGSLPLEGHGLWPADEPRFLFLVTPFVRGLPLDEWVRVHNPHALAVVELVRQAARLLAVVHEAGVVHRDVKGANLLVDGEGRLVLVDFGVATYEGVPTATGPFPPGTWPYLSPRVWRSWRGEEVSRASPGDDLWALGVELYRLLTGRLPFQGQEGVLVQAILREEPEPPHVLNPRVPRALGEVCQRMLRKAPEERYADAGAVDAALEAVAKEADEAWRVPLCEAWAPHHATTVRQGLWMMGEELRALHERLASYQRRPLRGRPLPPDERSTQGTASTPPEQQEARSEDEAREKPPAARSRWILPVMGALLVLGVCMWLAARPAPRAPMPRSSGVGTPWAHLAPESPPLTLVEPFGQEVAPPWRRPEGVVGAVPEAATTPAPVASATRPQDMHVKTPSKDSAPPPRASQQKQAGRLPGQVGGWVLTCTLATGCPATTPVLHTRALPPPAECPPRAEETRKGLGLSLGKERTALLPGGTLETLESRYVLVRDGPGATILLGSWGTKLPPGDTVLTGELFFGAERIHGRFTQAHAPDGRTYPICMVLVDREERIGVAGDDVKPGEAPGTARVIFSLGVKPVERFE
ncbi:protein kinase domain-containing protein [Archangium sp.]|uniref:serine/threonine protein kinase n=1 Tax=Archangium sp. TaxID=1872627 RepID=UPI00286A1BC9|nr:protein kinase [Archangium sp.]